MDGFRRTVDVTMWGAFHLLRTATQLMIKQGHGGVLTLVSSPHAFIPAPRAMAYNMSIAALEHMAKTAAIEVAEHRVRINMIQPGWIDTPGEHVTFGDDYIEEQGKLLPWGRLGTPEDIGNTAAFLCSSVADYITGEIIAVDGCFRHKDGRTELP